MRGVKKTKHQVGETMIGVISTMLLAKKTMIGGVETMIGAGETMIGGKKTMRVGMETMIGEKKTMILERKTMIEGKETMIGEGKSVRPASPTSNLDRDAYAPCLAKLTRDFVPPEGGKRIHSREYSLTIPLRARGQNH